MSDIVNIQKQFESVDYNPFEEGKEIEKVVRLNESQRELWLSCILGGDEASLAYNESVSLELEGPFDLTAFEKALHSLIARHEALRATVSTNGENLIIYREQQPCLQVEDISTASGDEQKKLLKSFIHNQIGIPFDLQNDSLSRFFIHKLSETRHYFTLIIHHIIGDGWSIGIMLQDLSKLYSAYTKQEAPNLEAPPQISDYAREALLYAQTEECRKTEAFWLNQYKGNIPVVSVPTDFTRPSIRTYKGAREDYKLDNSLVAAIRNLAKRSGCSLVSTLLTAFEVFLYHTTGQQDIVVGLPAAGQSVTGYYGLVGHCVNLLPLRSTINPADTFIIHLKNRKREIYDAYDHQRLTFSELLKKLAIRRDSSRIPLVPVVFNVDMGLDDNVHFYGLKHRLLSNPRVSQTFEISLNVTGSKDTLVLEWAYNTQLFKPATIKRMMDGFETLLEKITAAPDTIIEDIAINSTAAFQKASVAFPSDKTVVDLFIEQAAKTPGNTAVVFEGKKLSYRELDKRSNQLAQFLRSKGVKEESFVPLCISPSLEMIVGILGILKAGAAYAPIEPDFPADRISYMLEDTGAGLIISSAATTPAIKNTEGKQLILLDRDWEQIEKMPDEMPASGPAPENVVYLIYTSGSTGKPKGVMIEHRSLVDYLYGFKTHTPVEQSRSFALGSTIATDLGNTILYSSLVLGGELHLFTKEQFNNTSYIHQYFARNAIDCLKIVPSHWKALYSSGKGLYPKKLLIFGGEAMYKELINEIQAAKEACVVVNHYGPTETTIGKLLHIVQQEAAYGNTIPIGKPFSNTSVYVVNQYNRLCPIGVPGELYIGGMGVARGYLNRPELTQERFIPDVFSNRPGSHLYRTGDLVKWLPDGNIEYLGRIDDQVKIRGNRIELGEIGNVLQQHAGVKQSVVIAQEDKAGSKRLVAYVVPEGTFDKEAISSYLSSILPEYMIPRIIVPLNSMPLTDNGKVDRKALPEPEGLSETRVKEGAAPSTPEQKLVAAIWQEALQLPKVTIHDDFFELGGHSLIAIKVMTSIEKETGKRLPLASLFENSTIEKLAKLLTEKEENIKWDSLVPIKKTGSKLPVYMIHGGGLNVLVFKQLEKYMDKEQPIYGMQALGLNGKTELLYSIEEIAARYIKELLKNNPDGPYCLTGYSLGGAIAYEMAKQLLQMGKEIRMLGIMDTYSGNRNAAEKSTTKIKKKVVRQFKKVPFFSRTFIKNPAETVNYQLLILKNKVRNLFSSKYKVYEEFFTYEEEINRSYETAYEKYLFDPLNIKIDLFRTNKRIYFLDDPVYLGWKEYAKKGVAIHEVPGDHKTFLLPPNNKPFAEVLQNVLNTLN